MAMKGVLCIPQSYSITEALAFDCLVSYPEHSFEESYSSAEIQFVYSAASAKWARMNSKTDWDL